MFLKLPVVIAIELVIALLSFMLVGDKARVGEIAFVFTFLTVISALTYLIVIRFKS